MKLLYILFLLMLLSCINENPKYDVCKNYELDNPSGVWELPKELNEISGIAILNFPIIVCHNDEEGKIFEYNLETKNIISQEFGIEGDYEDIAVKNDSIFILQSNGTIHQITDFKNNPKVEIYRSFLSEKEDTEGLYYDQEKNRLLIACKNQIEGKNLIYEFDLNHKKFNENPVFSLDTKDFKFQNKPQEFSPSALAIHPKHKTLFIISSVGKLMIEISLEGEILNEYSLDYPEFTQPEGMLFSENGDLYISNEGKKKKPTILKFNYKP